MEYVCLQPGPETWKRKEILEMFVPWKWKHCRVTGGSGPELDLPHPLHEKPQPPLNKPNPVPAPQKPHKPTPLQKYDQKGKGGRDQRKEKTDSSRACLNWSLSKQLKLLIP